MRAPYLEQCIFVNNRPDPIVLKDFIHPNLYGTLRDFLKADAKTFEYHEAAGRYRTKSGPRNIVEEFLNLHIFMARSIFKSETLLPTYGAFLHYESKDGINPNLPPHRDDNACTYNIGICLYQTEPWDLYIEGVKYTLEPNDAVAFYGEDQEHWRPAPPSEDGHWGMVWFHYAEPDHWYFTKGSDYINVLRGQIV